LEGWSTGAKREKEDGVSSDSVALARSCSARPLAFRFAELRLAAPSGSASHQDTKGTKGAEGERASEVRRQKEELRRMKGAEAVQSGHR